ncbi:unnamed protein product [Vitrella brassicaformis CCMP3155]|uniref:Uncharacterized protein n=2 Tax=Vitrella brassicaformis TaxID=1169539 RepID=A0A0G4FZJ5_VITBC|nr:unnamed protein product [Vitrella brassicaformis CCMP3155]|eukprot:CEM21045.1 unnamed protein product [Vitrella brassicaformis CCMP3155]
MAGFAAGEVQMVTAAEILSSLADHPNNPHKALAAFDRLTQALQTGSTRVLQELELVSHSSSVERLLQLCVLVLTQTHNPHSRVVAGSIVRRLVRERWAAIAPSHRIDVLRELAKSLSADATNSTTTSSTTNSSSTTKEVLLTCGIWWKKALCEAASDEERNVYWGMLQTAIDEGYKKHDHTGQQMMALAHQLAAQVDSADIGRISVTHAQHTALHTTFAATYLPPLLVAATSRLCHALRQTPALFSSPALSPYIDALSLALHWGRGDSDSVRIFSPPADWAPLILGKEDGKSPQPQQPQQPQPQSVPELGLFELVLRCYDMVRPTAAVETTNNNSVTRAAHFTRLKECLVVLMAFRPTNALVDRLGGRERVHGSGEGGVVAYLFRALVRLFESSLYVRARREGACGAGGTVAVMEVVALCHGLDVLAPQLVAGGGGLFGNVMDDAALQTLIRVTLGLLQEDYHEDSLQAEALQLIMQAWATWADARPPAATANSSFPQACHALFRSFIADDHNVVKTADDTLDQMPGVGLHFDTTHGLIHSQLTRMAAVGRMDADQSSEALLRHLGERVRRARVGVGVGVSVAEREREALLDGLDNTLLLAMHFVSIAEDRTDLMPLRVSVPPSLISPPHTFTRVKGLFDTVCQYLHTEATAMTHQMQQQRSAGVWGGGGGAGGAADDVCPPSPKVLSSGVLFLFRFVVTYAFSPALLSEHPSQSEVSELAALSHHWLAEVLSIACSFLYLLPNELSLALTCARALQRLAMLDRVKETPLVCAMTRTQPFGQLLQQVPRLCSRATVPHPSPSPPSTPTPPKTPPAVELSNLATVDSKVLIVLFSALSSAICAAQHEHDKSAGTGMVNGSGGAPHPMQEFLARCDCIKSAIEDLCQGHDFVAHRGGHRTAVYARLLAMLTGIVRGTRVHFVWLVDWLGGWSGSGMGMGTLQLVVQLTTMDRGYIMYPNVVLRTMKFVLELCKGNVGALRVEQRAALLHAVSALIESFALKYRDVKSVSDDQAAIYKLVDAAFRCVHQVQCGEFVGHYESDETFQLAMAATHLMGPFLTHLTQSHKACVSFLCVLGHLVDHHCDALIAQTTPHLTVQLVHTVRDILLLESDESLSAASGRQSRSLREQAASCVEALTAFVAQWECQSSGRETVTPESDPFYLFAQAQETSDGLFNPKLPLPRSTSTADQEDCGSTASNKRLRGGVDNARSVRVELLRVGVLLVTKAIDTRVTNQVLKVYGWLGYRIYGLVVGLERGPQEFKEKILQDVAAGLSRPASAGNLPPLHHPHLPPSLSPSLDALLNSWTQCWATQHNHNGAHVSNGNGPNHVQAQPKGSRRGVVDGHVRERVAGAFDVFHQECRGLLS